MRGRILKFTRQSRRVFAQKTRPTVASLRMAYIPRGGGYL